MSALTEALMRLRPGVDFANTDNTLAGIRWDTEGVEPPTQEEIDAELAELAKPQPITVSRLRFKLELFDRGMLTGVEAAIAAAGGNAPLYWAEATEFASDHPLVQQIGAALGLSAAEIRTMFEAAATRAA